MMTDLKTLDVFKNSQTLLEFHFSFATLKEREAWCVREKKRVVDGLQYIVVFIRGMSKEKGPKPFLVTAHYQYNAINWWC